MQSFVYLMVLGILMTVSMISCAPMQPEDEIAQQHGTKDTFDAHATEIAVNTSASSTSDQVVRIMSPDLLLCYNIVDSEGFIHLQNFVKVVLPSIERENRASFFTYVDKMQTCIDEEHQLPSLSGALVALQNCQSKNLIIIDSTSESEKC